MSEKIKTIIKGILWTAFIGICLYATFIGGPRDRKKNEIPKPPTEVYNEIPKPPTEVYNEIPKPPTEVYNEIPKPSTEVYIVSNENVYHDGGCELIPADFSKSEIVTQEEAKTMGRIPCSFCEPDRIIEMEMEFYNEKLQNQKELEKELEMEMEFYNEKLQNQKELEKELEMEMEFYNEIIQNQDDPPQQFPYY